MSLIREQKWCGTVVGIIAAALVLISLTPAHAEDAAGEVVVGGKNFTESYLISELYALALEDAGYSVERQFGLNTPHEPLAEGELDLYPEYTSTVLLNYLDGVIPESNEELYEKVKEGEAEQYGIAVLEQSDVNDKTCIVLLKSRADELGIQTLSDLQKKSEGLKLADFYGWSSREDNLPRLEEIYGPFDFDIVDVDAGIKYDALDQGEVDVIPGNTTEAQLLDSDTYTVLEEDIAIWPDYYVIPLVNQAFLDENPQVEEIINTVDAALSTEVIQELIRGVDIEGEEYEDVALDFFEENIQK